MKLTIELVPRSSWYNNVRTHVSQTEWDKIRKKSYAWAGNVCQVCGNVGMEQGVKYPVDCHEIWKYDDILHTQTLTGFISLCPYCHKVKHAGLANLNGESHIVLAQLMEINGMSEKEAKDYRTKAFEIWNLRNQYKWTVNIDFIKEYLK